MLEDRRQFHAPVQHFVIETEEPASDLVCAQNSLIIVHREQKRYITTPAGSGCNVPRVSEILAEYTLLDTAGEHHSAQNTWDSKTILLRC